MDNLKRVKAKLETAEALPTLPVIASQAMAIANDPDASMKDLADLISRDPPLTAKIINMVNSACYALRQSVGSLPLALTVLGMKEIVNLVVGVSMVSLFDKYEGSAFFNKEKFWSHSGDCAAYSRFLAGELGLRKLRNESFLAGLVHDVGMLIMVQHFAGTYSKVLKASSEEEKPLEEIEADLLGFTHAMVGNIAVKSWKFPDTLCEAVLLHHDSKACCDGNLMAILIYVIETIGTEFEQRIPPRWVARSLEKSPVWKKLLSNGNSELEPSELLEGMKAAVAEAPKISA